MKFRRIKSFISEDEFKLLSHALDRLIRDEILSHDSSACIPFVTSKRDCLKHGKWLEKMYYMVNLLNKIAVFKKRDDGHIELEPHSFFCAQKKEAEKAIVDNESIDKDNDFIVNILTKCREAKYQEFARRLKSYSLGFNCAGQSEASIYEKELAELDRVICILNGKEMEAKLQDPNKNKKRPDIPSTGIIENSS